VVCPRSPGSGRGVEERMPVCPSRPPIRRRDPVAPPPTALLEITLAMLVIAVLIQSSFRESGEAPYPLERLASHGMRIGWYRRLRGRSRANSGVT
jgi:hypothetical protein